MYSRILSLALLLLIVAAPAGWAVEHQYATAKIVDVQRKTRTRVDMYLVNTPVGTEIPYFVMTVQLNQTQYIAEFTPGTTMRNSLPTGLLEPTSPSVWRSMPCFSSNATVRNPAGS